MGPRRPQLFGCGRKSGSPSANLEGMATDAYQRVLALAANTDDVLLSREAYRLGLSRRAVESLQRVAGQTVLEGAVAIPPIRDPLRTSARAAQLVVPSGVLSHATAAHLHGLQGIGFWTPAMVVDVTVPATRTRLQRQGMRLRFRPVSADERVLLDGLEVTSVVRTLADCASFADRISWISIVDSALHKKLLVIDELEYLSDLLRRGRCSHAVRWLGLVDGLSESPSETRVRVVLTDDGLPPDTLQLVVDGHGGYPIARLDIAYRRKGRKVGLEVDSSEHLRARALYLDRDKHNELSSLGWELRHVVARDAVRRPDYVVYQVRDALGLP